MAAVVTIEDFLTRYPEFDSADEDQIRTAIEDATLFVGDRWIAAHQRIALLALAAHYLFVGLQQSLSSGVYTRTSGTGGSGAAGPVVSKTVGPLSVTYQDPLKALSSGSSSAEGLRAFLSESTYGKRFLELMARSFPARILVV